MDSIVPVRAAFDAYSNWDGLYIKGGHYSVTDILDSPRIIHLRNRHKQELPSSSIDDMVAAFQGNAWHNMFERYLRKAASKEEYRNRFLVESKFWERLEGRKITGKLDCYDAFTSTLYDFKVTSTYKPMFGDFTDWEIQLNAYAWFLAINGFDVDHAIIVCIHPTWNKYDMMRDPKYPRHRIHELELRVWPMAEQEQFLRDRVRALRDTEETPDDDLPYCTDKDTWVKAPKFAIMEPGKSRATRVLNSMPEVEKYLAWRQENNKPLVKGYKIDKRGAERTRCLHYCKVNTFCNQYAEMMMEDAG